MSKRSIIVSHGHPNNPSWVEREFKRAGMATGGIYTGDSLIDDYAPTLIIMDKTRAMGKSEQMLNSMWPLEQKVLPGDKTA